MCVVRAAVCVAFLGPFWNFTCSGPLLAKGPWGMGRHVPNTVGNHLLSFIDGGTSVDCQGKPNREMFW